jgi:hypothetical protein
LSLFLGPDGGPRYGSIRLPPEKPGDHHLTTHEEEEEVLTPSALENASQSGFVGSIARKASSYFASRDSVTIAQETPPLPLTTSQPMDIPRSFARFNRTNGSAYGYGGSTTRPSSTIAPSARNASTLRRRRGSAFEGPTSIADTSDLNFAQRLLMANENAVTNIADLWVAAAMNVDNNDEAFEPEQDLDMNVNSEYTEHDDFPGSVTSSPVQRGRPIGRNFGIPSSPGQHSSMMAFTHSSRIRSPQLGSPTIDGSSFRSPTIFSHPGVRAPSTVLDAQARAQEVAGDNALLPIIEHRQPVAEIEVSLGKPPSLASQLPLVVILQYGLLALHSTTHDQVFLSYLVTCVVWSWSCCIYDMTLTFRAVTTSLGD